MKTKYKPKKSDIRWQLNLFNAMPDGGCWITDNAAYRLDKFNKTLFVLSTSDAISDPIENVARVAKVCRKIGWKVVANNQIQEM
ncbi:MAG: hypothetical protein KQI78_10870 [Deltaproteobacteria bacterium]|nr:hypothetical protein [Deltaproteobacteria bacterium]